MREHIPGCTIVLKMEMGKLKYKGLNKDQGRWRRKVGAR
jgi:hypothetical protein